MCFWIMWSSMGMNMSHALQCAASTFFMKCSMPRSAAAYAKPRQSAMVWLFFPLSDQIIRPSAGVAYPSWGLDLCTSGRGQRCGVPSAWRFGPFSWTYSASTPGIQTAKAFSCAPHIAGSMRHAPFVRKQILFWSDSFWADDEIFNMFSKCGTLQVRTLVL